MYSQRPISWIIISRLVSLAIFFIILWILSSVPFQNEIFLSIISFLSSPSIIGHIVTFSILFLIGEVFLALDFPLRLPGPFFNALGSVFLVSFLFQLFYLVDRINEFTVFSLFRPLESLVYFLVFLIVLIVQYVHLFSLVGGEGQKGTVSPPTSGDIPSPIEPPSLGEQKSISWEEVGEEFRRLIYDFFHALREALKKKE
jgi:hypothetical protein